MKQEHIFSPTLHLLHMTTQFQRHERKQFHASGEESGEIDEFLKQSRAIVRKSQSRIGRMAPKQEACVEETKALATGARRQGRINDGDFPGERPLLSFFFLFVFLTCQHWCTDSFPRCLA